MSNLLKLYFDGGPVMHLLVMVFLVAGSAMIVQAALVRIRVVPALFAGCSTALLGTALVGMGVGYWLVLDIVAKSPTMEPGSVLRGIEVASIPLRFALGMVLILVVIQFVTTLRSTDEVLRACASNRLTQMLVGLAVLALVLGAFLLLTGHSQMSGYVARGSLGVDPGETAAGLSRMFLASYVTSGVAALFAALAVVVSFLSVTRHGAAGAP